VRVPVDIFSFIDQRLGFPFYNWERMRLRNVREEIKGCCR